MENIDNVRSEVAEYFDNKANHRQQLAEEHDKPWDQHNKQYAGNIQLIADYIRGLPDDDDSLILLANCDHLWCCGHFSSPRQSRWGTRSITDTDAIHLGERWKYTNPDSLQGLFRGWVETAIEEAEQYAAAENESLEE